MRSAPPRPHRPSRSSPLSGHTGIALSFLCLASHPPTAPTAPIPHSTAPIPHSSAPIPHSTAPIPHSSALVPHSTAPIPHSSAVVPHSTAPHSPSHCSPISNSLLPIPHPPAPFSPPLCSAFAPPHYTAPHSQIHCSHPPIYCSHSPFHCSHSPLYCSHPLFLCSEFPGLPLFRTTQDRISSHPLFLSTVALTLCYTHSAFLTAVALDLCYTHSAFLTAVALTLCDLLLCWQALFGTTLFDLQMSHQPASWDEIRAVMNYRPARTARYIAGFTAALAVMAAGRAVLLEATPGIAAKVQARNRAIMEDVNFRLGPKDIPVIARAAGRLTGRAMGFVQAARTKFSSFADQTQLSELQQEVQQAMAQLQAIRHQLNSGVRMLNSGCLTAVATGDAAGNGTAALLN
ncbi:unnamed protein product [Closterium sp. Naga37s-1]|nr:unnamed protein product [Closterium sp. Naga37s-1]